MEYEVRISKDGKKVTTEVISAGEHNCEEKAFEICQVFGAVSSVTRKDDDQPVQQTGQITTH